MDYAKYDEDLWHQRLLLTQDCAGAWMVMTPTGDVFLEDVEGDAMDASEVRYSRDRHRTPASLRNEEVFRFAKLPMDAELDRLIEDAEAEVGERCAEARAPTCGTPEAREGACRDPGERRLEPGVRAAGAELAAGPLDGHVWVAPGRSRRCAPRRDGRSGRD